MTICTLTTLCLKVKCWTGEGDRHRKEVMHDKDHCTLNTRQERTNTDTTLTYNSTLTFKASVFLLFNYCYVWLIWFGWGWEEKRWDAQCSMQRAAWTERRGFVCGRVGGWGGLWLATGSGMSGGCDWLPCLWGWSELSCSSAFSNNSDLFLILFRGLGRVDGIYVNTPIRNIFRHQYYPYL